MLSLGESKPWPEALETLTGQRELDASALADYFAPLKTWLDAQNKKNNYPVGWQRVAAPTRSGPPLLLRDLCAPISASSVLSLSLCLSASPSTPPAPKSCIKSIHKLNF